MAAVGRGVRRRRSCWSGRWVILTGRLTGCRPSLPSDLLLDETLRGLAASVRPRDGYALIHGELGPDHVSIDDLGQPVVVDIEGAMYFDVEWEHAFLRLRFGRHYEWLRVDGLDERRMRLYALALDLSLIEGPLRLLDGDYPERELMLAVVSASIGCWRRRGASRAHHW